MKKIFIFSFLPALIFVFSSCAAQEQGQGQSEENPVQPEASEEQNNEQNDRAGEDRSTTNSKSTVIESIEDGQMLKSPVTISGKTSAAKDKLHIELRDNDHEAKVKGFAVITENEDGLNDFQITFNFIFNSTDEGYVAAYELDENGAEKNLVEVPVSYETN